MLLNMKPTWLCDSLAGKCALCLDKKIPTDYKAIVIKGGLSGFLLEIKQNCITWKSK